jgi:hypothetical protein
MMTNDLNVIDYFAATGVGAPYLLLVAIAFAICSAIVAFRPPSIVAKLSLLSYALLPLAIGIFGFSVNCQTFFRSLLRGTNVDPAHWESNAIECFYPLLFGSLLTAAFLFLTPFISLMSRRKDAEQIAPPNP